MCATLFLCGCGFVVLVGWVGGPVVLLSHYSASSFLYGAFGPFLQVFDLRALRETSCDATWFGLFGLFGLLLVSEPFNSLDARKPLTTTFIFLFVLRTPNP